MRHRHKDNCNERTFAAFKQRCFGPEDPLNSEPSKTPLGTTQTIRTSEGNIFKLGTERLV